MDRDDGHDNPPPGELSSFDISKRGGREIAAELATRMARWRSARKRPDAPARGPPARVATADPAAAGLPDAPPPNVDRPSPPTVLDAARAARIHQALRIALQARAPQTDDIRTRPVWQTRSHDAAVKTALAEALNMNAIAMRLERSLAGTLQRARAIGVGTQETGIAAGRALRAALETGADETLRRTRAFGAAAQGAGVAAWRALRAIGPAADRIGLAAWRSPTMALRNRLDEAPVHAGAVRAAAQRVTVIAWRAPGPALGHRIDDALRHARAIGAAAWHAKRDRVVIAGAAAIAVAVAGWFLVPSDRPASPDAPRQPDVASLRDEVVAPAVHPPEPPQAIAAPSAPAPQRRSPDTASARLPARLKPVSQAPTLAARLKPPVPEAPTADPPASQPQETTGEPRGRGDPRAVDSAVGQMFSDGHGLSRRNGSSAGASLLR